MGNNASSTQQERIAYQSFVANYAFIRKVKDPRYGEISILEDKNTREHVALKEILSKSTTDFNREIEGLKQRSQVSHPNIIRLIAYTSKAEDNLCASFYKILLIIDYLDQDFEREINARRNNSDFYTEEHLWYILESVLGALVCLHKKGIAHGDLKPSNIFISKLGSYKIAEQSLLGNVMPSYAQRLSGFDDVRAYLSPALVQNLSRQELYPKHDAAKSDIFTLGLSVLHAATLLNCDKFYNWDDCTIDMESIQKRLETLTHRYSEQLQRFLSVMLTADEAKRPSAYDLIDRIPTLDKQQQQYYLEQKSEIIEPKMNNFEKKQMPPLLQSLESQFGVPGRKEEGSGKKPPIGLSRSPQNAFSGEKFFKDDPRLMQQNNRLSGRPAEQREEVQSTHIKPFDVVNSNGSLTNLESEGSTVTANRSMSSQGNFKGNNERKETPIYPQYQNNTHHQQAQMYAANPQFMQAQTQPAHQPQFQTVQAQQPQTRVTGTQPGYRPSEEINSIIHEFGMNNGEDKRFAQPTYQQQQPTYQPQPQVEKPSSTNNVSSRNSIQNQSVRESTTYQPGNTSLNTSGQFKSANLQPTQQPQQQAEVRTGSYYKPSPEIERILQEIRARSLGAPNPQSNSTANNAANMNTNASIYSSPIPLNQQTTNYQPPVTNNTTSHATYIPPYQSTTAPTKQENSTVTPGTTQTGNVPVQNMPTSYQPKSYDQTIKPSYEKYYSGSQQNTTNAIERQNDSYQTPSNYSASNSSFSSTVSYGNTNQNQYAAPQDFQKTQYTQKENAYPSYAKENPTNAQYKEQYTKQQNTLTQQPVYPQSNTTYNPLQPISTNNNQHMRQSSGAQNSKKITFDLMF